MRSTSSQLPLFAPDKGGRVLAGVGENELGLQRCPLVKVVTVSEAPVPLGTKLSSATEVHEFWERTVALTDIYDPEKEHFVAIFLNRKNAAKGWSIVSIGSQSSTFAHPREVFRSAIASAAATVIVAHNHPSGDPSPSAGDIQITRTLAAAGKLLDIEVIDHVVIGDKSSDPIGVGHFSFRQSGLL